MEHRVLLFARRAFVRALLRVLVSAPAIFTAGCGGGQGGTDAPTDSGFVRGVASDDALRNATVTISTLSGSEIGSGDTGQDGQFAISVPLDRIRTGFQIRATGGAQGAVPFSGVLQAVYGVEDRDEANVTLLTTLVSKVAESRMGSDLLAKRDAVLADLARTGAMAPGKYRQLEPPEVRLDVLREAIRANGFDAALDTYADVLLGLNSDNPSQEIFAVFPRVFGGVISVSFPGADTSGTFSLFPGDLLNSESARIVVADEVVGNPTFELIEGPAGLLVDEHTGALVYVTSAAAQPNSSTFRVRIDTSIGNRTATGQIDVLVVTPLARESATGAEQTVSDVTNSVAVTVAAQSLGVGAQISIDAGSSENGAATLRVSTSEPLAGGGSIRISIPDPDATLEKTRAKGKPAEQGKDLAANCPSEIPNVWDWTEHKFYGAGAPSDGRIPDEWQDELSLSSATWNSTPNFNVAGTTPSLTWQKRVDYVLCGVNALASLENAEPVLFVHGYEGSFFGGALGGAGTFGGFIRSLNQLPIGSRRIVPFLFRWDTNQRYQDAAEALSRAVGKIKEKTGRDVHIIAHSFGGVLTRVYLQGVPTGSDLPPQRQSAVPIASVTSFGSPYGGLYSDGNPDGIEPGYDNEGVGELAASACEQVSCYQLGDSIGDHVDAFFKTSLGEVARRLNNTQRYPFLAPVRYSSAIGLRRRVVVFGDDQLASGDGLISYAGQRFKLHDRSIALRCGEEVGGATVRENLLGLPGSQHTGPGETIADSFPGYLHSSALHIPNLADLLLAASKTEVSFAPGGSCFVAKAYTSCDERIDTALSTIQGISGCDSTPLPFSFHDAVGVEPNTVVTSSPVRISGLDASTTVNVVSGSGLWASGDDDCGTDFRSTGGTIRDGQVICARHTSADAFHQTTTTRIVVGGNAAEFASTTRDDGNTAPAPTVSLISPTSMAADVQSHTLTINGSNFQAGNRVQFKWNAPPGNGVWTTGNTPSIASSDQMTVSMNPGEVNDTIHVRVCRSSSQTTDADCSSGTHAVTVTAQAASFSFSPSSRTVAEGAGSTSFTLNRAGGSGAATVYVSTLSTSEGSSNSGDYSGINSQAVTFASGETSKTVTINITNDSTAESNETFGLIVQQNAADAANVFLAKATFTITDDDSAPGSFSWSPSSRTVAENGGSTSFTLNRSGGSGSTTVFVSTTQGEGSSNSGDYSGINSQAVTFASGETSKTITINIANDSTAESSETFGLIVQQNAGDAANVFLTKATFTITDDDSAPAPSITNVSPSSYPANGSNQGMTISGSNFVNGATLTFDPPTGSNLNSNPSKLSFVSSNRIDYQFNNASDVGTWRVRVNNPDGQQSGWTSFAVN
jgi:pimeloyl-ACP methyl ester carboxylesterase